MMRYIFKVLVCLLAISILSQCKEGEKNNIAVNSSEKAEASTVYSNKKKSIKFIEKPKHIDVPEGMAWVSGGTTSKGAVIQDEMAMDHEKPAHQVAIDGFFMDITEVTNAQFNTFVIATGYETIAERAIDWEDMKKQLPEGTQKPNDSILQPGSLTFKKAKNAVENLYDFSQWWKWTIGANWKHPNGPESSIEGKENDPVVHIAYEDALSYCEWAGRRLPTEAEWEKAAKGDKEEFIYFWGDNETELSKSANTWEGQFPVTNTKTDGFESRSPVSSFQPNDFGLYDMAGNVWEWTSDWYNTSYYSEVSKINQILMNPKGAETPFNDSNPYAKEKVIKGGSFLCNASYCASYRISARMATSLDSSLEHVGFRTVATVAMIQAAKGK